MVGVQVCVSLKRNSKHHKSRGTYLPMEQNGLHLQCRKLLLLVRSPSCKGCIMIMMSLELQTRKSRVQT